MQESKLELLSKSDCDTKLYGISRMGITTHIIKESNPRLSMTIRCNSIVKDGVNNRNNNTYSIFFNLSENGRAEISYEAGFIFDTLKEKYFNIDMLDNAW